MSRVDVLKQAKDARAVKFLEFTAIAKNKHVIAIFFEGEDEKYYSVRINNIKPDWTWHGINCDGKENVLALRSTIRNHTVYQHALCLFFVDADFDDNRTLEHCDDIYLTPCYSIENFYISIEVFKRILRTEFQITEYGEERACFAKAVSQYETCKAQYLACLLDFNCWIKIYRGLEKAGKVRGGLNLNGIKLENIIQVELDNVEQVYASGDIKDLFPNADNTVEIDVNQEKSYFNCPEQALLYRGKQNLEFFIKFLLLLKEDRCQKNDEERIVFERHVKVKLNISYANALSELSQYADTPACLIEFLKTAVKTT